jgi:hypothetical protein
MSLLKRRLRRVNKAVAVHLSERIEFVPKVKTEFSAGVDDNRPGVVFMGHLRMEGDVGDTGGEGNATWKSRVAVSAPVLSFGRDHFPSDVMIFPDDEFIAIDRDRKRFIVTQKPADEIGRVTVRLAEVT